MNKKLVLQIEEDYLIAVIEPLNGKFTVLSLSEDKKFPLYFSIDNINHKIDYSFNYKIDYQDGKTGYVGDFLTKITDSNQTYLWYDYESEYVNLLLNILTDIKILYFSQLRKIVEQEIDESSPIPTEIVFSDNVAVDTKNRIKSFLEKQNFEIQNTNLSISEIIVSQYILKNHLQVTDKKYAVIEAIGTNLNFSLIQVNGTSIERTYTKSFADYGIDPRIQVIAKKIVDDVNRQEGLLSDTDAIKKEYKRHQTKAIKIVQALKKFNKPFMRIETAFTVEPNKKLITNLLLEDIDKLCFLHARQFSSFFTDHFLQETKLKTLDLDKIFLIGNTLSNDLVKKEFSRFGEERMIYISDDVTSILQALFIETKPLVDEDATMFMQNTDDNANKQSKSQEYTIVSQIILKDIRPNQKIKISTFDPAPGKGAAHQEFECVDINKLKIISSSRSLSPGDIAIAVTPVWINGIQIDLEIYRSGAKVGIFRTRPVVKIEIQ